MDESEELSLAMSEIHLDGPLAFFRVLAKRPEKRRSSEFTVFCCRFTQDYSLLMGRFEKQANRICRPRQYVCIIADVRGPRTFMS